VPLPLSWVVCPMHTTSSNSSAVSLLCVVYPVYTTTVSFCDYLFPCPAGPARRIHRSLQLNISGLRHFVEFTFAMKLLNKGVGAKVGSTKAAFATALHCRHIGVRYRPPLPPRGGSAGGIAGRRWFGMMSKRPRWTMRGARSATTG
jgi:hypothetical protein